MIQVNITPGVASSLGLVTVGHHVPTEYHISDPMSRRRAVVVICTCGDTVRETYPSQDMPYGTLLHVAWLSHVTGQDVSREMTARSA